MGSQSKQACYSAGGPVVIKRGGVMPIIKGQPMNPITKAKRNNGVPGYKAGGKTKPGCKC